MLAYFFDLRHHRTAAASQRQNRRSLAQAPQLSCRLSIGTMQSLGEFLFTKLQNSALLETLLQHDGAGNLIKLRLTSRMLRQEVHNSVSSISMAGLAEQHFSLSQHSQILVGGSWPCLTSLDLTGVSLSSQSIAHLGQGHWPLLTNLNLSRAQLDPKSIRCLTQLNLRQLQSLNLSWNWLTDTAAVQLRKADWPNLRHLSLRFNLLRAPGVAAISRSSWPLLHSLNLRSNFLDSKATAQLVQGHWPLLEHLDLRSTRGIDLRKLKEGQWPQLQSIAVNSIVLDTEAVSCLLQRWPRLKIESEQ